MASTGRASGTDMFDLAASQRQAPHRNHVSVPQAAFAALQQDTSVHIKHVAFGSIRPPVGAMVKPCPRILICLSGHNEMIIPQGDHHQTVMLQPGDAVYVQTRAWKKHTHTFTHTFMGLDFEPRILRYFIRQRLGGGVPGGAISYAFVPIHQNHIMGHTIKAAEGLVGLGRTSQPDPALQGLAASLVHQARTQLETVNDLQHPTAAERWAIFSAYVEANLHEAFSREDAAQVIDVHPNHLSRIVKQHTGMSYIAFVKERRLRQAAQLLTHYDIPIREVAQRCGFPTYTNFCNAFRSFFGKPPGKYRSLHS